MITGTDTNVGKTHVTCLLARQLIARGIRVAAYKPVCSGAVLSSHSCEQPLAAKWEDLERLREAIGGGWPDELLCPQRFLAPLAPPVAARLEGRIVDFERMVEGAYQFAGADLLLIEGAGGWLSPVTQSATVADLARKFSVPILIVAWPGLGTINHTLLTIESIRSRGLDVAGVVFNEVTPIHNDDSCLTNGEEIAVRGQVPFLGIVPYGCDETMIQNGCPVTIDWITLARHLPEGTARIHHNDLRG